jgi:nucleoside triphosphatase
MYMIFLVFTCRAASNSVAIGVEFEAYAWVSKEQLADYDLNLETRLTFMHMGLLPPVGENGA